MPALARIANSAHPRMPRSMDQGLVPDDREIEVTILLRENPNGPALDDIVATLSSQPLSRRQYYTREQFAKVHGSHAEDRRAVRQFAARNSLTVVETNVGARTMRLRGTAASLNAAFGVRLHEYIVSDHGKVIRFHAHTDDIHVDDRLFHDTQGKRRIEGIFGLDSRPIAQPRFRLLQPAPAPDPADPAPATPVQPLATRSYDPPAVAAAYNYPVIDGTGVTIGIVELGGTVSDADVTAYFSRLGLPKPVIKHVSVDGARAFPDPGGADVEVALDVQVIGAMAPGCTIVIYDAPNSEQGFIDALAAAANDAVNKPIAVSISWGAAEAHWTPMGMVGMDRAAMSGAAMGVTFTAAAGDNGATDGIPGTAAHTDHPSSAPHILACGGTNLQLNPNGTIQSETVWGGTGARGATGGGVSDQFNVPAYQANNGIRPVSMNPDRRVGRGDPDVGGVADPATGYNVTSGGRTFPVGGTSAVAPQWAALFALASKQLGKGLGFVQPLLYAADQAGFHDITVGNNGDGNNNGYRAQKGYDLCTGRGTPDAQRLIDALAVAVPTPAPAPASPAVSGTKRRGGPVVIVNNDGGTVHVHRRRSVEGPAAA